MVLNPGDLVSVDFPGVTGVKLRSCSKLRCKL
jgi:hypothetical protein